MKFLLVLLLLSCDGDPVTPAATCASCAPEELCVVIGSVPTPSSTPSAPTPSCQQICANALHCWSGCCVPVGDTGYNVCAPAAVCGL